MCFLWGTDKPVGLSWCTGVWIYLSPKGKGGTTTAQAVSRRVPTVWAPSQTGSYWTAVDWSVFALSTPIFLCQFSFSRMLYTHLSSEADTIGPLVTGVPSGPSSTSGIIEMSKKSYPRNRPWRPIGCKMLKIPHCLDNRLTSGGKVVSPTHPPHFTPQKHYYFYASGTHFC
jgi:hypothetical protein